MKEVGELGCLFYGEAYDEVPIRMRACGQWQAGVGVDAKVGLGAQPKHEQAASAVQDLSIPAKGGGGTSEHPFRLGAEQAKQITNQVSGQHWHLRERLHRAVHSILDAWYGRVALGSTEPIR